MQFCSLHLNLDQTKNLFFADFNRIKCADKSEQMDLVVNFSNKIKLIRFKEINKSKKFMKTSTEYEFKQKSIFFRRKILRKKRGWFIF